jgi:UrcA family protein
MSKKYLIAGLLLALSGVAGAASPVAATEAPQVVVNYGDLNVQSSAGVRSLYARINTAAAKVCSPLESRTLSLKQAHEQCVSDAVAESVATVDNAQLTNLHQRRIGRVTVVAKN